MRVLGSVVIAFCMAVVCGSAMSAWAADEPVPPPPGHQDIKKEQPAKEQPADRSDRERPAREPAADTPARDRDNKGAARDDRDRPPAGTPPRPEAPPRDAPRTDAPRSDAPRTDAPRTEAPRTDAPRPEAPRTELPRGDVPRTDLPRADAPRTGTGAPAAAARGRFDMGFTLDRQSTQRAIVADLPANSVAARAGLRRGDIITSIGNTNVTTMNDVGVLIERYGNRPVPITVLRDGRPVTFEVTYVVPAAPAVAETPRPLPGGNYLGLQAATVVLVTDVTPDGLAARAGLQPGDLIHSVNNTRVESFTQFTRAVSEAPAGDSLALLVERGGKQFTMQLPAGGMRHEALRPTEPGPVRTVSPPAAVPVPAPTPPVVTPPPTTVPPTVVPDDDDRGRPGRPRLLPGRR